MKNFNWPVVGHEKIIQFLQKNIENGKLAHAYLFSGKEHLGKSLLAEQFIASILCNDYNEKNKSKAEILPCGQCVFCSQIAKGIHPDIYFLKKEEDKKNISVEQVREMQKLLQMASFLNSYKIALIENAEDLSESAQNALLKILEEPKPKTILILISSDHNLLLPTIVSRCQLIKFFPVSNEKIFGHLINLGTNREQASIFAALACGQIGLAIDFYKKSDLFNEYLGRIENFLNIFNNNINARFKILEKLLANFKTNLEIIDFLNLQLDSWQLVLRDILAIQNHSEYLIINLHFKDKLAEFAKLYSIEKVIKLQKEIDQIKKYLNYNINPRLAVENLVLNF